MNLPDRPPNDLLDSAIAQLREPPPDTVGGGLEREVLSRISPSSPAPLFPIFMSAMAALAILLLGVGFGLLNGIQYERELEQRFEEAYVASIHPIVGVSAGEHGHGN